MLNLVNNNLFYCKNKDTYPPFKNGFYLEEYILDKVKNSNKIYDNNGRLYLPILWTNFQIESWFSNHKEHMQRILDVYLHNNKNDAGYFTIVQYDDGPLLKLPENTIIYGACSGMIPIPLIYEDRTNILENIPKKTFSEKNILCSFVGSVTHGVRHIVNNKFYGKKDFAINPTSGWTPNVSADKQSNFINLTVNSKFALAPRGYGRSSFRFFEIFKLGTIPIYVWDDIEWLPYKEKFDYSTFCISINIKDIDKLENILNTIDENRYNIMLEEYNKIKYIFSLDYLHKYIFHNH
jgi:hypothetical protein